MQAPESRATGPPQKKTVGGIERKIIETIRSKWEINSLKIIHRIGIVLPSELSMVLIVTSSHRKESYEASQFFVDQLKKTVPIWKKEFFEDGTVWINDKIIE